MKPSSIVTIPYRIARAPLAAITSRVAARLPEQAVPRRLLDRVLGSSDRLAGQALGDPALAKAGEQRVQHSDTVTRAADLEAKAAQRRRAATQAARAGRERAEEKAEQADDRLISGAEDAARTEARGKQAARSQARSTAARKKREADAKAKAKVDEIDRGVKQTEAVAAARTTTARKRANAVVNEAGKERSQAARKRSDADELGDLAGEKRAARRSPSER